MKPYSLMLCTALALSACSGDGTNPFMKDEEPAPAPAEPETEPFALPGTSDPQATDPIQRREARAEDSSGTDYGNGFANDFAYDSASDTFQVEGLAFDGDNPPYQYTRGTAVTTLSKPGNSLYAVYEAPTTVPDFLTNSPISQLQHRVIYGVSDTGQTEFAVVRTGSYVGYGFGGFIYQRNNSVVMPTSGQASYGGDYAGLRDFDGSGGLEYVTGDADVAIDFEGFLNNCSGATCADAVRLRISNREIFDVNGNNITATYLAAANSNVPTGFSPITALETITTKIGPNVMTENGEATGEVFTSRFGDTHLEGNYYLVMSGDHTSGAGGEIVGIVVLEGEDPRGSGITERETGAFIVKRR